MEKIIHYLSPLPPPPPPTPKKVDVSEDLFAF